jgi:hypothetical protein
MARNRLIAQKIAFWAILPTGGQAITMKISVLQSKQKLFLAPTGATFTIETRRNILGKQEIIKSGGNYGKKKKKIKKQTKKQKKKKNKKKNEKQKKKTKKKNKEKQQKK